MERLIEKDLLKWKESGMQKPLMVIGVRQVGKTYTITKFCRDNFKDFIYIDLEKDENIRNIFEETIDPDVILSELELRFEKNINLDQTIFFFDEVQVSERFIVSLKYFNQSHKPFKIICAGSLLGVKLNRFESSFPVGKVELTYMNPLNFEEFLMATEHKQLLNRIITSYQDLVPMPDDLHLLALELYKKYLCVGGMPESVLNLIENNLKIMSYNNNILDILIEMYLADMSKYTISKVESAKIEKVYKSISSQLANETSRRFIYKTIESNASKRKYESSIDWLISSGMAIKCNLVEKINIPLKAFENVNMFKIYLSDVGILTSISGLNFSDIMLETEFMFKGAITENYVACEFTANRIPLNYWHSGNQAEIDFLLYNNDGVIPVEVKAGKNTRSQSLRIYVENNKPKYSIRISTKNFGFDNKIKSVPLYAVFCIK